MKTQHTPGPWTVTQAIDGRNLAISAYESVWAELATVYRSERHEGQAEANASLIAAAPDQIAELIRIEARVAASMPTKHDDLTAASVTFTGADLAKLRAIIAKATGTN